MLWPRRFSLRVLLILTTAVCLLLGYWVVSSRRQRDALNVLRQHQYNVAYEPLANPDGWRGQLARLLGDDFVLSPWGLYSNSSSKEFHGDLEIVRTLTSVRKLTLDFSGVNNEDLRELQGHPNIDFILLNYTQVTDEGIGQLVGLPLESLHVEELALTDACIDDLTQLSRLKVLQLTRGQLSDTAIERLKAALPDCTIQIR